MSVSLAAPGRREAPPHDPRFSSDGLGATLGLLCDIVVSSEAAKWGDPHINIGLVPGDGGLAIWTVLIGPNKAKEMMMLGTTIDATKAENLGLINLSLIHI